MKYIYAGKVLCEIHSGSVCMYVRWVKPPKVIQYYEANYVPCYLFSNIMQIINGLKRKMSRRCTDIGREKTRAWKKIWPWNLQWKDYIQCIHSCTQELNEIIPHTCGFSLQHFLVLWTQSFHLDCSSKHKLRNAFFLVTEGWVVGWGEQGGVIPRTIGSLVFKYPTQWGSREIDSSAVGNRNFPHTLVICWRTFGVFSTWSGPLAISPHRFYRTENNMGGRNVMRYVLPYPCGQWGSHFNYLSYIILIVFPWL